ncbi:MAG: sensor histidine kinase [Verrucomicrobiaceae bacterium]|nr:sensor histidine kinase [Verrucomicrobiaceae bacterium]
MDQTPSMPPSAKSPPRSRKTTTVAGSAASSRKPSWVKSLSRVPTTAEAAQSALQRSIEGEDLHRLDLARRLHKDVAGNLVACTAMSEMVRHQLGPDSKPAAVASTLALIDKALRDTLQIVRELTEEQFPPVLTAFGMSAALQQFVKQMVGGFTGALILHLDEDELKLDPVRRLHLFRLLQTMIRRCVCDARAGVVEVSFVSVNGDIECMIDHDGETDLWSPATDAEELAFIQARCALLGGTLCYVSSPTGGTSRVTLSIPRSNSGTDS